MAKRVVAIVLVVVLLVGAIGGGIFILTRPTKINGDPNNYNTVTLKVDEQYYYDVRVPAEATLTGTDQKTFYRYDLLTVGVQDSEPTTGYKVKIANRWVYAVSDDNWVAPTVVGFEDEQPYEGWINTHEPDPETNEGGTNWGAPMRSAREPADQTMLASESIAIEGSNEFFCMAKGFGRYEHAREQLLKDVSVLYDVDIWEVHTTDTMMWVESNGYAQGFRMLNFNTFVMYQAYGEEYVNLAAYRLLNEEVPL